MDGAMILFNEQDPPRGLKITMICSKNHHTAPQDSALNWAFEVFDKYPEANKAIAISQLDHSGNEEAI